MRRLGAQTAAAAAAAARRGRPAGVQVGGGRRGGQGGGKAGGEAQGNAQGYGRGSTPLLAWQHTLRALGSVARNAWFATLSSASVALPFRIAGAVFVLNAALLLGLGGRHMRHQHVS